MRFWHPDGQEDLGLLAVLLCLSIPPNPPATVAPGFYEFRSLSPTEARNLVGQAPIHRTSNRPACPLLEPVQPIPEASRTLKLKEFGFESD